MRGLKIGEIRHMLLMVWGGENMSRLKQLGKQQEISRSKIEIRRLRVVHRDLKPDNIL
jgi:serine/threonine protein kinase